MYSFWEKEYWLPESDIAIIGSGLVGLFTANFLVDKYPNAKISVYDRSDPPLGASTRNAGFACFGTVGETLADLESLSEDEVIDMIRMRWSGLSKMRSYLDPSSFEYKDHGGKELFRDSNAFDKIADSFSMVNNLFAEATGQKDLIQVQSQSTFPGLYSKCCHNPLEGQLNPVLLVKTLMNHASRKGVSFYLNSELNEYLQASDGWKLGFSNGLRSSTGDLIITTNAFTETLFKGLDIQPYRNQVMISKPLVGIPIKGCYHLDEGYIYFRNVRLRLLVGGGRHFDMNTEKTNRLGSNHEIQSQLLSLVRNEFGIKNFEKDIEWSGIIATGGSKKPIVQKNNNEPLIAVRSGGMGVAISSGVATEVVTKYFS